MAATMTETTMLKHLNVPPKQTWNYLKINDTSLTVIKPKEQGEVFTRLPEMFGRIESGIGPEAVKWIENMAGDSHYIEVPAHRPTDRPIVVDCDADKTDIKDTGIIVRNHANATIVMLSHGKQGSKDTSANLLRIYAEHDAHVSVVEIMALPEEQQHIEGLAIDAQQNSRIEVRQYALGGGNVVAGLATNLAQDRARLDLVSRYFVRGHEKLDLNHVARQRGCDTKVEMSASGLLTDSAQKTLRETIDLIHGDKGSKGNELETVLVEGDHIVNKTLPVILCDEEDVQGNHGASIGSIGPEQTEYLATRGLAGKQVSQLFATALFDDALIHAPGAASQKAVGVRASDVLGERAFEDSREGLALEKEGE